MKQTPESEQTTVAALTKQQSGKVIERSGFSFQLSIQKSWGLGSIEKSVLIVKHLAATLGILSLILTAAS